MSSVGGLGTTVLAVTWSEFAVGTILFLMRIYTNGFITRRWKPDFLWAAITYVLALIATVFLTISVEFGLGRHLTDLVASDPELIPKNQFYQWMFTTFAIVAIALGKIAIIVFILQIEGSSVKGRRKYILYIFAVSNIIINIIILPIIWCQCSPTAKVWNNSLPGNCAGRKRNELYGYFQGSYGAALDLALALYPIFIFWNLQLRLHIKVGLMALFGFGIVAAVSSAIKTYKLSSLTATSDITHQLASLNVWASTEMWIVFIVSCIPTVRPIFVRVFDKVYTTGSRSFGTGRGYIAQPDTNTPSVNRNGNPWQGSKPHEPNITSLTLKNDSEENILPGQDGIMLTRKVSVHYEGSESVRSMNNKWGKPAEQV
ncbi:MAG: hypothetical protein M1818_008035 [Claussenomyces sp. TS43310]|nr:MAG: hypothetical protein M1818_008035 [Claussenomyces sp. TS43310]